MLSAWPTEATYLPYSQRSHVVDPESMMPFYQIQPVGMQP